MGLGDPRVIFNTYDMSGVPDLIPASYVGVTIQAPRGPMWKGKAFTNQEQGRLIETYGDSDAAWPDILMCLKAQEQGANLYIHRIGHCTDIADRTTLDILAAKCAIQDRGGLPTAGYVESIAGPFPFNQALSGRVTGTEIGPYNIVTGSNDAFLVRVGTPGNWGADQPVTLAAGAGRTAQQVCDEFNAATTGINAVPTADGKWYCKAINVGDDVEILTVANDCYSALGLTEAVYSHVEGTDSLVVSIDGAAGQTFDLEPTGGETGAFELTSAEVATQLAGIVGGTVSGAQNKLRVTSSTTGTSSTVQVQAATTCETAFSFDNDVHAGTAGAVKTPWKLVFHPGAFGNDAKCYVYDSALQSGSALNIRITCPGASEEYFPELVRDPASPRYWRDYILARSNLVTEIEDFEDSNAAPNDWPAIGTYTFSGGDDGTLVLTDADWVGNAAGMTGLYCTDEWYMPYIHLFVFGTTSANVKAATITFAENHHGRRIHMATPPGADANAAIAYRMGDPNAGYSHAAFDSHKTSTLRGRFTVFDSSSNAQVEISALPYLAAAICRTDKAHGRHWSPFGIEQGECTGIMGIDDNVAEKPGEADLLAEYQINNARILRTTLENRGNEGAYLWGGWTDQREKTKLQEFPISAKIAEFEWLLYPFFQRFLNKPNHPTIWKEICRATRPLFRRELDAGAIFGFSLIGDEDAFFTAEGELKGAVLQTGLDIDRNIYRLRMLVSMVPQILYFTAELGLTRTGEPFSNFSTMYSLPGWARR